MTAFVTANLPSNVNTVEKLAVWAMSILAEVNPSASIITAPGVAEKSATVFMYNFSNQSTSPERVVGTVYLPLAVGWRSGGKNWNQVTELSNTAIPASYTAN